MCFFVSKQTRATVISGTIYPVVGHLEDQFYYSFSVCSSVITLKKRSIGNHNLIVLIYYGLSNFNDFLYSIFRDFMFECTQKQANDSVNHVTPHMMLLWKIQVNRSAKLCIFLVKLQKKVIKIP